MTISLKYLLAILIIVIIGLAAYNVFGPRTEVPAPDSTPRQITLTGTYVCLPHVANTPGTKECTFGLKTDDGTHYAVNFGASATAMQQFQGKERITAEGFLVIREALSDSQWAKYDMKGIFTITRMIDPAPTSTGGNPAGNMPTFTWVYAGFEAADIPRTKISILATYPDGTKQTKDIDTIEGSCNVVESTGDVYAKSEMIMCYYAGFGRYYKVVDIGSGAFAVQRREFEEASPDYNPPVANFETIAEF